jgi:thioredoxin 2
MSVLIARCTTCGSHNRIPAARRDSGPLCGKCRIPLPPTVDQPVDISDATFASEVLQSSLPVLVDCWASWCAPCRTVAPVLDELAKDYAGRIKVAKLNTEENRVIPARFGIQSIPTMLLFRDGELVDTVIGAMPKRQIESRLQQLL